MEETFYITRDLINMLLTVTSGVLVFIFSQLVVEWFKPVQELNELRADVAWALVYYGNTYTNPYHKEEEKGRVPYDEASTTFRRLAAEIEAYSHRHTVGKRKKKRLRNASSGLIGLSNSMYWMEDHRKAVGEYEKMVHENLKLSYRR